MKSESDPTRILSDSDEFRRNPGRIPTERNPTTTVSDPIGFLWKMSDSDEIRLGSDRFRLDLPIVSDWIYRSDWITWGINGILNDNEDVFGSVFYKKKMTNITCHK
jgi:hypothetical protein